MFLFPLALAPWHDTRVPALLVGLPAAIIPTALATLLPGSRVTRDAVRHSAEANEAFGLITSAMTAVNDMNKQIAAAVEEQSHVASDLSNNLSQISNLAQGASTNPSQSKPAIEDVAHPAGGLNLAVNRFAA
jgi:methyl-accepting chemotaxis protein